MESVRSKKRSPHMADVVQLISQLRVAADTRGADWLQSQVAAVLGEREDAPVTGGRGR